jgi:hypothetical protein
MLISYHHVFLSAIVLSVGSISGLAYASDQPAASLDVNTILQRWENNYRGITSMRVSYYEKVIEYRPPADEPNIVPNLLMHSHVERVEKGRLYHVRHSMAEDGFAKPENITEHAFDGIHTQDYWGSDKYGTIQKGPLKLIKAGSAEAMMNSIKKYMLLESPPLTFGSGADIRQEIDPNGIAEFKRILTRPHPNCITSVNPNLESVSGELCHVIEITHKEFGILERIWIAHEKGMLVMKHQTYHYRDHSLLEEIEVEQIGYTQTDGGGIWYPAVAYRMEVMRRIGTVRFKIVTHTFIPNITVDENTFRFDFPSGTRVSDKELGLEYVVGIEQH